MSERAGESVTFILDVREQAVAQWVFDHGQAAGKTTQTLPAAKGLYLPLKTSRGVVGVLGVHPADPDSLASPEQAPLPGGLRESDRAGGGVDLPASHLPLPVSHPPVPVSDSPLPVRHPPVPVSDSPVPVRHPPAMLKLRQLLLHLHSMLLPPLY